MLVLYETAAGYALFKLLDDNKIEDVDAIWDELNTPSKAQESLHLVSFKPFKTTADALENITSINESKVHKTLKKMLKSKAADEKLAVGDDKLGKALRESLEIKCVRSNATDELMRVIRAHLPTLLGEHKQELDTMSLALAHTLGRYKVKFNPEKLDTMIVQAVSLIDDLDKELNNYAMRLREWYGWHFPEIGKIIPDHTALAKTIRAIGSKSNAVTTDLSGILPEDLATKIKEEAEMSMGTELSDIDIILLNQLCTQLIELYDYRLELNEYLKNRMTALAPNLTVLLGELIGARLVSRAGSLVNLAKYPASTVQILGAEKALFRALKTKRDTPKYGIIYHAQLISQASTRLKGKMARKLAAKISLSTRVDALCDEDLGNNIGLEARAHLETQLKREEGGSYKPQNGIKSGKKDNYKFKSEVFDYDQSADTTVAHGKRKGAEDEEDVKPAIKKAKVEPKEEVDEDMEEEQVEKPKGKKNKKGKQVDVEMEEEEAEEEKPKSKKNKKKQAAASESEDEAEEEEEKPKAKKDKKKKKPVKEESSSDSD
jgi:nucleolar protein 58